MIAVDIPGLRKLNLEHLVLDYNGTLAEDGNLLPGVAAALKALAQVLQIHVVTADTFGSAAQQLAGLPLDLIVVPETAQAERKLEFIQSLNADKVVAVGNGRNDRKMLEAAAIGIALIQREGSAVETLLCADIAATDILDALALFQYPKRLVATLLDGVARNEGFTGECPLPGWKAVKLPGCESFRPGIERSMATSEMQLTVGN